MSVIRAGSNPENLYIYGGAYKWHFHISKKDYIVSIEDLYDFFEECLISDCDVFEEKFTQSGISVWMDWVNDEDGRNYKVHVQHEDWNEPIIMWEVTWNYILNDFKRRLEL